MVIETIQIAGGDYQIGNDRFALSRPVHSVHVEPI